MSIKQSIKIDSRQLDQIVKESVAKIIESCTEETIKVEDYFDVSQLSKSDVQEMATDIRIFLQGQGFGADLSDDGELIVKEGASNVMPIGQLRKELKKLGFKPWQIKSRIECNKVRIVILYADIAKNTTVIENKMMSCGWTLAHVSQRMLRYGIPLRVMDFDPKEQRIITKEVRKYQYLYHWTPFKNLQTILKNGIEARSENDYLSYPPKAHLMKGDIPKTEASKLGWMLYNKNKNLHDGEYALLRISMNNVPSNVDFFGDPRFAYGYFTKQTIPPQALELYGKITYSDKYNYKYEQIQVLSDKDTML